MDMQMPVIDGLTATREIRRREHERGAPRTPICMLTANALPEHVRESIAAGADRHLGKPLSAEALLTLVGELLQ
jgi:CheY-like chemotaxis protein